jgi:hypothetical protein
LSEVCEEVWLPERFQPISVSAFLVYREAAAVLKKDSAAEMLKTAQQRPEVYRKATDPSHRLLYYIEQQLQF